MPGPRETSRSGDAQRRARLSRLLALVLRHRPDEVGPTLHEGGFAPMEAVARDVGRRHTPDALAVVIFARRAHAAGIEFRRAGQALFLTGHVLPEFLLLPDDLPEI